MKNSTLVTLAVFTVGLSSMALNQNHNKIEPAKYYPAPNDIVIPSRLDEEYFAKLYK